MKPLKRIYHYLQQRYGAMWSLLLFVLVMLGLIVVQVFGWSANWHSPDADKYLGWMYACNLGCLLIISVQLLRLDCRRLLSRRTAEILNTCGAVIFILMFIRNRLDDHVTLCRGLVVHLFAVPPAVFLCEHGAPCGED